MLRTLPALLLLAPRHSRQSWSWPPSLQCQQLQKRQGRGRQCHGALSVCPSHDGDRAVNKLGKMEVRGAPGLQALQKRIARMACFTHGTLSFMQMSVLLFV